MKRPCWQVRVFWSYPADFPASLRTGPDETHVATIVTVAATEAEAEANAVGAVQRSETAVPLGSGGTWRCEAELMGADGRGKHEGG